MNQKPGPSPNPLQIARSLVAREATEVRDGEAGNVEAALKRTCLRVSENVRDSLGEDGWTALLARAVARSAPDHPALQDMRRPGEGATDLCAVVAGIEAHGVAAVTAALEALLAALIEILGRLIGEDMAIRLIDHGSQESGAGSGEGAS